MRFIQSILAGAAIVAAAFAVEINDYPKTVEAGKTYKITYTPGGNTPTTLILRKGDNSNLDTLTTLTESATGGEFQWSVDASLANGKDYALEIRQGTDVNYIGPITLTGGTNATPSASSKVSSTAASSTAASTTSAPSTLSTHSTIASISSSMSGNATVTSATLSRTATPKPTSSATDTPRAPQPTGAAAIFGSSPLAIAFGAVAAMAFLN